MTSRRPSEGDGGLVARVMRPSGCHRNVVITILVLLVNECSTLHVPSVSLTRSTARSVQMCSDGCATTDAFSFVTDDTFEETVLKSQEFLLLALGATWCGPCKTMCVPIATFLWLRSTHSSLPDALVCSEPHLKELRLQGDVRVAKVMLSGDGPLEEIIEYLADAGHEVTSLPVCVLFRDGKPVDALVGRAQARSNHSPHGARSRGPTIV